MNSGIRKLCLTLGAAAAAVVVFSGFAWAHCDTLDGPVVIDARAALDKADVAPVLKWVSKNDEPEVRDAFQKALAVRKMGAQAEELADNYFLETLVRVHRSGEGAPYTGLKAAGSVKPAIAEADKALETGDVERLVKEITGAVAAGIRQRITTNNTSFPSFAPSQQIPDRKICNRVRACQE